jgi:hypothetical protein
MKTKSLPAVLSVLVIALALAWLGFGCGKPSAGGGAGASPGAKPAGSPVSVERTSFAEVTSQLDPGGNFYLYLGTAQWLEHLSTQVDSLRKAASTMPGLTAQQMTQMNRGFDIAGQIIKDSGVEDVTGVGMSSVEYESGMFRNKMLLHHYAGTGDGFLWKLGGQKPHALDGLNLLPANTAFAAFGDLDFHLLWTVVQDEIKKSGSPKAQAAIAQFPVQFEARTGLKWDAVVNSLGGEVGMVLTLNESNSIPLPLPTGLMTIPEPGLMLVLRINDDTIFDRIDQQMKSNPKMVSVEDDDVRMRTVPGPVPFLPALRPSVASSGGYLFISTSDALINDSLAVKSGKLPGLKSEAEFKHLAQDIPEQGNQFTFMSERFSRVLIDVQHQVMNAQAGKAGAGSAQMEWIQKLFQSRAASGYTVGVITPEGCLSVGNGSQSLANVALIPAVAVPAMLSAVALPNFVRARETSQRNACINNLRQLEAAKNEWALENKRHNGDVPTQADLMPYVKRWPICPAGGTYTINPLGQTPECSVPGHKLP